MKTPERSETQLIISYLRLRRWVGLLGVLLPGVLFAGNALRGAGSVPQSSISAYYATPMRDVLVGVLFVIGWFLFSYRGYDRRDNWAGNVAGILAMAVALFPSNSAKSWVSVIHAMSAAGFFLVLAYFSIFRFTKSAPGQPITPQKKIRNRVYRICGSLILISLLLIAVVWWKGENEEVSRLHPRFWLESTALWAFGFSWFVKGETLWKDALDRGRLRAEKRP